MPLAYIIDDELHSALLLKDKLLSVTEYFDKIEIFTKPLLAYHAIQNVRPDLIFSDIDMPLIKGVDLHNEIANLNIPFIYVTAYSSYSIKAIKLQAFDYILKPVKESELDEAIKRFIIQNETKQEKQNSTSLTFHEILNKQKDKLVVNTSESMYFIPIESILKIEALNNYSKFYFQDSTTLVASKTLKYFEDQLNKYGFIRVHKSFLVNLTFIDRIMNRDGGQILLINGDLIDVTREKRAEIKDKFRF